MVEELIRHGLCAVGRWVTSYHKSVQHLASACPTGINYEIHPDWIAKRDVVYAIAFGPAVRYLGETSAGMASRFNGYRYGNPLESDTDNRVKLAITQALVDGTSVEIWASCPVAILHLPNGEVIQVPASKPLEEHLIGLLAPDLNRKNLRAASLGGINEPR